MLLLPAAIIQNGPTFKSALVHTVHGSFWEIGLSLRPFWPRNARH